MIERIRTAEHNSCGLAFAGGSSMRIPVSIIDNRWDEKAGLRRDALSSQVIDAL